jgi:formamidopyrimidine-DNA glycosylase
MPELPEVEHARRVLARAIEGRKLTGVKVHDARIAKGLTRLSGRQVLCVERKGKWIRMPLDDGRTLYSHLGMTGHWVRRKPGDATERFERARFDFGATSMRYLDARLFGRLVVARSLPAWDELGPDPIAEGIDVARLHERLSRTKRTVKETLMDQGLLAGVGNIYAIEALWHARVLPARPSKKVTLAEARAIAKGIKWAMKRALDALSPLEEEITYVEEGGENPFKVYGRAEQPCPRCKTPLVRSIIGGRGTVHCPTCQT